MQYACDIARKIKQHPLFDANDESMFIAAYIFEMIFMGMDVTELVWNIVLSILFEQKIEKHIQKNCPKNLMYDLPEQCQEIINRMLYSQNIVAAINKNRTTFNHGPIIERFINVKFMRDTYSVARLSYEISTNRLDDRLYQNIKNKFYNRRTRQILKHREQRKYNETQYNMKYGQPSELL